MTNTTQTPEDSVAIENSPPTCFGDRATLLDDSECDREFCDAIEDCAEKVFGQWVNQLLGGKK